MSALDKVLRWLGYSASMANLQYYIARVDVNGDGVLNLLEFLKLMRFLSDSTIEKVEDAWRRFSKRDKNAPGYGAPGGEALSMSLTAQLESGMASEYVSVKEAINIMLYSGVSISVISILNCLVDVLDLNLAKDDPVRRDKNILLSMVV